jgi:hypothetical protein
MIYVNSDTFHNKFIVLNILIVITIFNIMKIMLFKEEENEREKEMK